MELNNESAFAAGNGNPDWTSPPPGEAIQSDSLAAADPNSSRPRTTNVQLRIAYDGGRYAGWQIQPVVSTIQGVLEKAIRKLTGETLTVYSAGRTDSGVHALGQVANFHTASPIPAHKFAAALQALLPDDIVLLESRAVPDTFHSTFSARWKRYRYIIDNGPFAVPFLRNYSWWLRRRLDVPAMQQASQELIGRHDFRSFESDWPNKVTSVRTVYELNIFRTKWMDPWSVNGCPPWATSNDQTGAGDSLICLEIAADGFLYNMVRAITGTLVNVGRGRWSRHDVKQVLEQQNRSHAGSTAPAQGLYLVQVEYEHAWPKSSRPSN